MKSRKILILLMLTVILSYIFVFMSCNKDNIGIESEGIESGFVLSGSDPIPEASLGYRADTREFDVDDLTLEVCYGWVASEEYILSLNTINIEIVAENLENEGEYSVLKTVLGFNSLEYICHWSEYHLEYNHSDLINIPEALLLGDEGEIRLSLINIDTNKSLGGYDVFIYKKIGNGRVRIDEWWTKYDSH